MFHWFPLFSDVVYDFTKSLIISRRRYVLCICLSLSIMFVYLDLYIYTFMYTSIVIYGFYIWLYLPPPTPCAPAPHVVFVYNVYYDRSKKMSQWVL